MSLKIDSCPACGDKDILEVVTLNEGNKARYLEYSKEKYANFLDSWIEQLDITIDTCSVCGHHWYREQPDNAMLSEMYAKGRPLLPQNNISIRAATPAMLWEMGRLKSVLNIMTPSLLDYGSGFGRWARAAIAVGFKVTAYEPSEERGLEKDDINFTLVHDIKLLKNSNYDAINLEQVLEHVLQPIELLKELHGYCSTNTLLRITVPNVLRCPEGSEIWSEWPYNGTRVHTMAPFEHLQGFTPKSLQTVAIRAGFIPASDLRVWFKYPKEMIRSYVGKLFPKLGQTFLLLKINNINK